MKWIIARYNEDVGWAKDLNHFIVQKGEHLPNEGREASSYLWYIKENYDKLDGDYVFCQGKRGDHPSWDKAPTHRCGITGAPHHPSLDIKGLASQLGIELPHEITFRGGAEFKVSAEQIRRYPKEWYEKAYTLANEYPQGAWIFERLWGLIFMV